MHSNYWTRLNKIMIWSWKSFMLGLREHRRSHDSFHARSDPLSSSKIPNSFVELDTVQKPCNHAGPIDTKHEIRFFPSANSTVCSHWPLPASLSRQVASWFSSPNLSAQRMGNAYDWGMVFQRLKTHNRSACIDLTYSSHGFWISISGSGTCHGVFSLFGASSAQSGAPAI